MSFQWYEYVIIIASGVIAFFIVSYLRDAERKEQEARMMRMIHEIVKIEVKKYGKDNETDNV